MRPELRLVAVALLAGLAGCSLFRSWHNPNLPPEQEAVDERDCRKEADADLATQAQALPDDTNRGQPIGIPESPNTPFVMSDRSELRHTHGSIVSDCMERKGYTRGD